MVYKYLVWLKNEPHWLQESDVSRFKCLTSVWNRLYHKSNSGGNIFLDFRMDCTHFRQIGVLPPFSMPDTLVDAAGSPKRRLLFCSDGLGNGVCNEWKIWQFNVLLDEEIKFHSSRWWKARSCSLRRGAATDAPDQVLLNFRFVCWFLSLPRLGSGTDQYWRAAQHTLIIKCPLRGKCIPVFKLEINFIPPSGSPLYVRTSHCCVCKDVYFLMDFDHVIRCWCRVFLAWYVLMNFLLEILIICDHWTVQMIYRKCNQPCKVSQIHQ